MAKPDPVIVGYGSIAAHVSEMTGVSVSKAQAFKLAHREDDPLPTFAVGRGRRRPRGVRAKQLNEWIAREYREVLRP